MSRRDHLSVPELRLLNEMSTVRERFELRRLRRRLVVDQGRTLIAYDAHQLLEDESDHDRARPGHPLG
jgi:hypothetical protein